MYIIPRISVRNEQSHDKLIRSHLNRVKDAKECIPCNIPGGTCDQTFNRVSTASGNQGNQGKLKDIFPVREKSGKLAIFQKIREKSGNFDQPIFFIFYTFFLCIQALPIKMYF